MGYLTPDEYKSFVNISQKTKIPYRATKLGDILMVRLFGVKFYADNE